MSKAIIRFGGWLMDAYIRWSLFLSSYVPLLLIFGLRLSEKHPSSMFLAVSFAALVTLNLLILLNVRLGPRDFAIRAAESGSGEVAGYTATYLLPFLVVGDLAWRDLLAYGLLVLTIGQAMTRDNALHINPLLSLLGYRIYTVTTTDGAKYSLVTNRRIKGGDRVRAVLIRERLMLER